MLRPARLIPLLPVLALVLLAPTAAGCVGLTAHLLYFWKGDQVPAAFDGLEGRRVAVVCVSDASAYGPGAVPTMLGQRVEQILREKVKEIRIVGQEQIADWIDHNDWDQIDYRDIGKGVRADMVLAIDLESLQLQEGQTLFKGRANVKTTVYDMTQGGKIVYSAGPREYVFPQHTAVHAADTSEAKFRQLFLLTLARHIARHFHSYELKDDFGGDAAFISR